MTETNLPPNATVPPPAATPPSNTGKIVLVAFLGCGGLLVMGFIFFIVLAILFGEDKSQSSSPTATSQTQPVAPIDNSGTNDAPTPPTAIEALRIVYPEGPFQQNIDVYPDEIKGFSYWNGNTLIRKVPLIDGTIDENTPEADRYSDFTTTVSDVVSFKQSGQDKIMVIMSSIPKNDRSVEPLLGAAVLAWENGRWIIKSRSDDLTNIESSDENIPAGRLVTIGPDRYGYLIDFGWTGQGIVSNMIRIVGQNDEGLLTSLNDLQIGQNNEGAGLDANQTYSFDSKIEILDDQKNQHQEGEMDSARDEYWPLRITRKGTCMNSAGAVVNVDMVVNYQMYNEGYSLPDGTDPIYDLCALN